VKIDGLSIREIRMRLKHPFQTSFGTTVERRVLLVEAQSDGLTGYGEITAGMGPFYNPETTETSWHIFGDYARPLIVGREVSSPSAVPAILDPIRGHEMTKAGVENALWDLDAQRQGVPLATLLGGTMREIACGVSLGIKSEIGDLLQDVAREVAAGYQRIKIKIKPGQDVSTARAIRSLFPNIKLMVDANSAYSLADAEHLREFDELNLLMIEQPLDWDDIAETQAAGLGIVDPFAGRRPCVCENRHLCH
jgi:O-succinylbenzoate synthase